MTATSLLYRLHRSAGLLAALTLALAACSGAPQKTEPQQPAVTAPSGPSEAEYALSLPRSEYSAQFAAADAALARLDWMGAEVALTEAAAAELESNDQARLIYLQARIAHLRGDQQAYSMLSAIDQPGLHPAIAQRVHNFQRHLLGLSGDYLASARLGTKIMLNSPRADRAALKRSIWRDLQRLDRASLASATADAASDPQWNAWLELAQLANRDTTQLAAELPTWLASNQGHPAANPLPGGLEYLLQTAAAPDTVALLLPLSGRLAPAGKAVRDGYLASYYQARRGNSVPSEILVLDSDLYGSAAEAYQDAALQGAKLIVGPLSKEFVAELAVHPSRAIPVLALNQVDSSIPPGSSALVQLALAPEDEAARIAELAFGQGARRALVMRPAGTWGDKMERALRERWQELGGTTASVISYTGKEDYSPSVKSGLGIAASEERKRLVRDMLATNVEFTPRRRQDLDIIFMLARNGAQARALKPLLAFHYAGALPVYATSSVYSGSPDSRDKDLDDLQLVDLPWLLGSNPTLKSTLAAADSDQYPRLNALGADAFRVQSRFLQLQAGPDALLRGDTGLLSLNPQLQIQRELPAATFDGGELQPR